MQSGHQNWFSEVLATGIYSPTFWWSELIFWNSSYSNLFFNTLVTRIDFLNHQLTGICSPTFWWPELIFWNSSYSNLFFNTLVTRIDFLKYQLLESILQHSGDQNWLSKTLATGIYSLIPWSPELIFWNSSYSNLFFNTLVTRIGFLKYQLLESILQHSGDQNWLSKTLATGI